MTSPQDYVWVPTAAYIENANVTRLARTHGLDSLADLRARSIADVGWYWDAAARDLGIPFRTPYTEVVDLSRGVEFPDWFVGGRINVVDACTTRWSSNPATANRTAVVHEAEDGTVRTLSFAELDEQVRQASAGLRGLGIGKGDAVGLFLPMIAEAVVAVYAVARIGAIIVPLFSGFAPAAITSRLNDAQVKAVIVADGTVRRRRAVAMKPLLDIALTNCPSVEQVIVIPNLDAAAADTAGDASGAVTWSDLLARGRAATAGTAAAEATEPTAAMDTLLLAYTSGTTGQPKGAVHTHAGFLVKTASELAYSFDVSVGDTFTWITDMGWIMGPLSIIGTHANGATLLLYEGSPDVPDLDRIWEMVQRHRISQLGVSPTLARTLQAGSPDGRHDATRFDLSALRIIGSTGEPWDPESYSWLAQTILDGRVPIINFSGGTEIGGSFLAPYPVEPIRSCSLGGPSLGMDVDVFDDQGHAVRGEIGELVCKQPWPAMTRGVWRDPARYLEAYWSTYPGVWRHGDYALVDADGSWFILGRSDDVMNVAGKRLASAEIESVLSSHSAVAEVAAVGVPDPKKGEAIWVFWVARPTMTENDLTGVGTELSALVAAQLGKPFTPSEVVRVPALPKTRSAKILRRAMRAAVTGSDPGDLSGAENPESIDVIREIVANL